MESWSNHACLMHQIYSTTAAARSVSCLPVKRSIWRQLVFQNLNHEHWTSLHTSMPIFILLHQLPSRLTYSAIRQIRKLTVVKIMTTVWRLWRNNWTQEVTNFNHNRNPNAPINSKLQHPPPSGHTPGIWLCIVSGEGEFEPDLSLVLM